MAYSRYWKLDSIGRRGKKLKVPRKVRKFMQRHIRRHIKVYKMPPKQAVRVAYEEARAKYKIPLRQR